MKLDSIQGNSQRLDGGAMFGNCPRALWSRWLPADEQHRISLACRCLLVREDGGRTVLLEAGIGAFFEPSLRERYGVQEQEHVLLQGLAELGLAPDDIDVIVLSHLHFDHAGGLLTSWREGHETELAFPRAHYVVGREAWERAKVPHFRDRASFIPEICRQLEASHRLEIVEGESALLGEAYGFNTSNGHTPGQMHTRIETPKGPVTFAGDLIPGVPWVHLPITMGYDRFPELLIEEKQTALDRIIAENGWVFFTHDAEYAACRIERDERGRYVPKDLQRNIHWSFA